MHHLGPAEATSDPSSVLGAAPAIPKLPHLEREAKCHHEVLTHQVSQKVSQIGRIHVEFRGCLCRCQGFVASTEIPPGAPAETPRAGGGSSQRHKCLCTPVWARDSPDFREDDAVCAPQSTALFPKEFKCPVPTTRMTTLRSYKVSADKTWFCRAAQEPRNYSSLLGILLLSREGKSYSHLEQWNISQESSVLVEEHVSDPRAAPHPHRAFHSNCASTKLLLILC